MYTYRYTYVYTYGYIHMYSFIASFIDLFVRASMCTLFADDCISGVVLVYMRVVLHILTAMFASMYLYLHL